MKNIQPIQSIITLTALAFTLSACGNVSFKNHEALLGGAMSTSGDRYIALQQSFKGACDTGDKFHPLEWCGGYDNYGFVKDHAFQIKTNGEPIPLSFISSHLDEHMFSGQWQEAIPGNLYHAEYIHNADHHYVLASARIFDFVEINTPIVSGQYVVYKINLSANGSILSIQDVKRFAAQCNLAFENALYGKASPNGNHIAIVESGPCIDGPENTTFYDAHTLDVTYTTNLPSLESDQGVRRKTQWTVVSEGATDAELALVTSEPRIHWNSEQSGPNSMGNPLYREAVVNYVAANEEVAQSESKSAVFIIESVPLDADFMEGQPFRTQVRFTPDGSVSEQELVVDDTNFKLYWSYYNSFDAPVSLFDFTHKSYRQRSVGRVHYSPFGNDIFVDAVIDEADIASASNNTWGFDDDPAKTLSVRESYVSFNHDFNADNPIVDGAALMEEYEITESMNPQQMLVKMICVVQASNVDGDSYGSNRTCTHSWGGLPAAVQNRAYGQFAWTFNEAHELHVCLPMAATENAARNAAVDSDDLIRGCNGNAWEKMNAAY